MIYRTVDLFFNILMLAIFIRAIISWLPVSRDNNLVRLLYQITDPILTPIRTLIERSSFGKNMMIDFSPVIAFLVIGLIKNIVLSILR